MFNTLGRATSQTGKESGSGWAVCEQVSAQARQTRSPIPAVTAPGMEMFPSSYVPRHEVNIGIEPFILSLSDPFIAAVRPFSTLIRAPCPLLNELAQPGSSSRVRGTTHWRAPTGPGLGNLHDKLPNRDVNGPTTTQRLGSWAGWLSGDWRHAIKLGSMK